MIKVSVIVPTYNPKQHLLETLLSVLHQTYTAIEILVVDDGSTVDAVELLQPYISAGTIRYIWRENGGTAAARNTGITNSSGELIAFLDHDDIWLPDKIARQVEALNCNPLCGLTYCNFNILDEQTGTLIDPCREGNGGRMFDKFLYRNYITTASQIMIRRSCLERIGLFDESLEIVDDYDLYLRLSRHYEVIYDDDVMAYWRSHQNNTSKNYEKAQLGRIKVKERLLNNWQLNPKQKKILLKGLYEDYYAMAYNYLNTNNNDKASKYFIKAFKYNAFKCIMYYLASKAPLEVYPYLKSAKSIFQKN